MKSSDIIVPIFSTFELNVGAVVRGMKHKPVILAINPKESFVKESTYQKITNLVLKNSLS